jgi:hypothetical protein
MPASTAASPRCRSSAAARTASTGTTSGSSTSKACSPRPPSRRPRRLLTPRSPAQLDTGLGDVLPGIQVRSTKYKSGSLLVHKTDADDDRFVLVTGSQGAYDIRGWITGSDGKREEFWKVYKTRGAYWVPQDALKPFTIRRLPSCPVAA